MISEYLLILLVSAAVPLLASFYPPLRFYHNLRPLVYTVSLITGIFGAWDVLATFRGHWQFNPAGVWGLRIINLPVEEVLFFIVIPFCCIFTWEALLYIRSVRR